MSSKAQLERKALVDGLRTDLTQYTKLFLLQNLGLTVKEFNTFRKEMRSVGVKCVVSKNTLMKKAVTDSLHKNVEQFLHGPSVFLFANTDEVEVSKKVVSFISQAKEKISVSAASLSGTVISPSEITTLSTLPPLKEIRASILGILSNSASGLLRTLQAPSQQLLRLISKKASS